MRAANDMRVKWRSVAAIGGIFVLALCVLAWWMVRDGDDPNRLVDALEQTALPDGTFNIIVSPVDDEKWMAAVAGMSGVSESDLQPVLNGARWIAYASAPASYGNRSHYEILTVGFDSPDVAERVFEREILEQSERMLSTRFVWRSYGSTIQGAFAPPSDFLTEFPEDAPILDLNVSGAAYRLNATGWAESLLGATPEDDRENMEDILTALGISLDPDNPSVISGAANSDGVIEGGVTGWQETRLEHLPGLIASGRIETCDDTGEQCHSTRSNVEIGFRGAGLARVVGSDGELSSLTPMQRNDMFPDEFLQRDNLVGYVNPHSIVAGLRSGVNTQYRNDFRWFNFAITPSGTVFLEPFLEAAPKDDSPAPPSDS